MHSGRGRDYQSHRETDSKMQNEEMGSGEDEKEQAMKQRKSPTSRVYPYPYSQQWHAKSTRPGRCREWYQRLLKKQMRKILLQIVLFTVFLVIFIEAHPDSVTVSASNFRRNLSVVYTSILGVVIILMTSMAMQLPEPKQRELMLYNVQILSLLFIIYLMEVTGYSPTTPMTFGDGQVGYRFITQPIAELLPLIMLAFLFNLWGNQVWRCRFIMLGLVLVSLVGLVGTPHTSATVATNGWTVFTTVFNVFSIGFLSISMVISTSQKFNTQPVGAVSAMLLLVLAVGTKCFSMSLYWMSSHPLGKDQNGGLMHDAVIFSSNFIWCCCLPLALVWERIWMLQTWSLRQQTKQKEMFRQRFFRWVFHEVRVPLNNVYMILQDFNDRCLLSNNSNDETSAKFQNIDWDEFCENITSCLEDCHSLGRTLDSVKDFDIVANDQITVQPQEFTVVGMFAKLSRGLVLRYRRKRIPLKFVSRINHPDDGICHRLVRHYDSSNTLDYKSIKHFEDIQVFADCAKLEAAFGAILDNAFRFSAEECGYEILLDVNVSVHPNPSRRGKKSAPRRASDLSSLLKLRPNSSKETSREQNHDPGRSSTSSHNHGMKGRGRDSTWYEESSTDKYVKLRKYCPFIAYLSVVITDCGSGIPEQSLQTIFEPFANLSPTSQGSGLSLCIAKSLIGTHDGSISVTSQQGVGTSFTIDLELPCNGAVDAKLSDFRTTFGSNVEHEARETGEEHDEGLPSLSGVGGISSFSPKSIVHSHQTNPTNDDKLTITGNQHGPPKMPHGSDSSLPTRPDKLLSVTTTTTSSNEFKQTEPSTTGTSHDPNIAPTSSQGCFWETSEMRFLVVDDVTTTCKLLKRGILRRIPGATVDVAYNGKEAVDTVLQKGIGHYTYITMDKEMPVMDGYEATELLREHLFAGRIVGLTGNALADDLQKFLSKGADFVMTKPVDIDELCTVLQYRSASSSAEYSTAAADHVDDDQNFDAV